MFFPSFSQSHITEGPEKMKKCNKNCIRKNKKNNSFYTIENFSTISTATQIRNKKLDKFFMALKAGTTRIVA